MTDTEAKAALLACPFCGGGNVKVARRDVEPQGDPWYGGKCEMFVECNDCACTLFDKYWHDGFVDEAAAIAAWNTRPTPSAPGPAAPGWEEAKELRHKIASVSFDDGIALLVDALRHPAQAQADVEVSEAIRNAGCGAVWIDGTCLNYDFDADAFRAALSDVGLVVVHEKAIAAQAEGKLEEAVAALEWYAGGPEMEKFYIVDSDGERVADFSLFSSRAKQALEALRTHVQSLAAAPAAQGAKDDGPPYAYAYRYPHYAGGTVVRFDTGGREINGAKPIETIPLYLRPLPAAQGGEAVEGCRCLPWSVEELTRAHWDLRHCRGHACNYGDKPCVCLDSSQAWASDVASILPRVTSPCAALAALPVTQGVG